MIHVVEATAEDTFYSVNADFFEQLLPQMDDIDEKLSGEAMCQEALSRLVGRYDADSYKKSPKSLNSGTPKIGADILGDALRKVIRSVALHEVIKSV